MKKGMGKGISIVVMLMLLIVHTNMVYAADIDQEIRQITMEQTVITLPLVQTWCYISDNTNPEDVKLQLNGEDLEEITCRKSNTAIDYYFFIDISGSVPTDYFNLMKQEIAYYQSNMRTKDTFSLISFGNDVQIIEQDAGIDTAIAEKIEPLANDNDNTSLYEALQKGCLLASEKDEGRRTIFVCMTDGEDCSEGQASMNEVCSLLEKESIPLYGLVSDSIARQGSDYGTELEGNPYIEQFGEMCRSTGGNAWAWNTSDLRMKMEGFRSQLYQAYLLSGRTEQNYMEQEQAVLQMVINQETYASRTVWIDNNKSIPDTVPPEISKITSEDNKITIVYSENVENGDNSDNYHVTCNGETLEPQSVAYYKKEHYAVLTFPNEIYKGTYTFTFTNIHDCSIQKNVLEQQTETELGVNSTPLLQRQGVLRGIIIAGAVILSMLVAGIAAIVLKDRRRSRQVSENQNKEYAILTTYPKYCVQVNSDQEAGIPVTLKLMNVKEKLALPFHVDSSIMVGRSRINEVCIEDKKMSRQHFAIGREGNRLYIEDLKSKNGTSVNGIPVRGKTELHKGDVIGAGTLQMMVGW